MRVSHEQIQMCRRAPLAEFLLERYPDEFMKEGRGIVAKDNPSFTVAFGIPGFIDHASGAHGNPIDYLMQYKRYKFQDAVVELYKFLRR